LDPLAYHFKKIKNATANPGNLGFF